MLTVYTLPISLYCAKLRILLRRKNLDWQEVPPPGGYGSDEYKVIVPSGNLPAIIDGDLLIADSEAIAEYLNEKHPDPPMLPIEAAQRARARERSRFHDTRLEPELRKLFPHIAPRRRDPALAETQSRKISERLDQFATMLGDGGSKLDGMLTLGDCGFPITFTWIEALGPVLGLAVEWPETVVTYRNSLSAHAAVATELAEYRPKLAEWLEGSGGA
jgi:glutathione S-transferase